jgi:hypothetical protein
MRSERAGEGITAGLLSLTRLVYVSKLFAASVGEGGAPLAAAVAAAVAARPALSGLPLLAGFSSFIMVCASSYTVVRVSNSCGMQPRFSGNSIVFMVAQAIRYVVSGDVAMFRGHAAGQDMKCTPHAATHQAFMQHTSMNRHNQQLLMS